MVSVNENVRHSESREPEWQGILTRSLRLGLADPKLFPHLDDILTWYGSDTENPDLFLESLVTEFGDKEFRKKFEECMDRLTVSNFSIDSKQLFGNLTPDLAKVRYRKLIRVFHPDRGENQEDWLNYRAERLNVYFKEHIQSMETGDTFTIKTSPPGSRQRPTKKAHRMLHDKPKKDWRTLFGDPKLLERRILMFMIGVLVVCTLLLLLAAK